MGATWADRRRDKGYTSTHQERWTDGSSFETGTLIRIGLGQGFQDV